MSYKEGRHFVIYDWGNNHMVARFSREDDAREHMQTVRGYDTWVLYQEMDV